MDNDREPAIRLILSLTFGPQGPLFRYDLYHSAVIGKDPSARWREQSHRPLSASDATRSSMSWEGNHEAIHC
jgi:hypothetical protein